ncbi:hypothetical protein KP509_18G003900 [Ceratopteris richardii]|uniref:Uncharacterized protein n=1 Tax=Ceratopteris richardii TaxID=49495 RepID=A0A8T2SP62_CERRI|nr:hypothetical protein KP509_18G003900 [Ceratopteris richardii]
MYKFTAKHMLVKIHRTVAEFCCLRCSTFETGSRAMSYLQMLNSHYGWSQRTRNLRSNISMPKHYGEC